jgi:hypothetical protein
MDLFLRRVIHPQSRDNYRVVLKENGDEIEIGSIGVQYGLGATAGWKWGIDCVVPMRDVEAEGTGKDRADCMKRFRSAWDKFSADSARLTEFLGSRDQSAVRSAYPGSPLRARRWSAVVLALACSASLRAKVKRTDDGSWVVSFSALGRGLISAQPNSD